VDEVGREAVDGERQLAGAEGGAEGGAAVVVERQAGVGNVAQILVADPGRRREADRVAASSRLPRRRRPASRAR
jgi:hypothetical protein